jgi:hypothetical protein
MTTNEDTPQTEIPIIPSERRERADQHYSNARLLMAEALKAMRDKSLSGEQVAALLEAAKVEAALAGLVYVDNRIKR